MKPIASTKLDGAESTILILFRAKSTLEFEIVRDQERHQVMFSQGEYI
jgi:hypothetical protein